MGLISEETINYINSSQLFSRIKRQLKNFDMIGLIDENNFPDYVSDILNILGISAMKEEEVILNVKGKKVCLPKGFKQLYAAYKCLPKHAKVDQRHLQNVSVFEHDITTEVFSRSNGCEISCDYDERIIEKITLKQYVNDRYITSHYNTPILLSLSPNVKPVASSDCLNMIATSEYEISINDNTIYTNFDEGFIYMKYYGLPIDDDGLPMIPEIQEVENAIEAYILWKIFQDFWLAGDVVDAIQKMQYLQKEYDRKLADARFILKLPRFSLLINSIRNKKGINMLNHFSQIDNRR